MQVMLNSLLLPSAKLPTPTDTYRRRDVTQVLPALIDALRLPDDGFEDVRSDLTPALFFLLYPV
jgi:hypothetical protein